MQDLVAELDTDGYTIVRGFLSPQEAAEISEETHRLYQEGPKHRATYRHKNLLFEVLDDPEARRRVVLQAHWTAWISPLMERMRRSEQYFTVLEPFLGPDIKQISHQVHWKPPGAKYTSYRFHQDARFREGNIKDFGYLRSTVTTGLAIDRQTAENGALRVMPGSHHAGYRRARRVGVSRRRSTPLGPEPQICKYEQLRERPGPFYIDSAFAVLMRPDGSARAFVAKGSRQAILHQP